MRRSPWGLFVLAALLSTLACILDAHQIAAQPYRGYRPRDTVFRITGTNIANWEVARELKLDYTRHYQAWRSEDWDTVISRTPGSPLDSVETAFYRLMHDLADSLARPVKLITPVYGVGLNLKTVRCFENYAKADPTLFHNLDFATLNTWGGCFRGPCTADGNCNKDALEALPHKGLRVIKSAVTCRPAERLYA